MATEENQLPQELTELFGPVISRYTRAQAIEDGLLVDVTEWAGHTPHGMLGGFLPEEVNRKLWNQEHTPVCLTRALWDVVDIERNCPECDARMNEDETEIVGCEACGHKGTVKQFRTHESTRGRAHDVIWMGKLAAVAMLCRGMDKGWYKVLMTRRRKDGSGLTEQAYTETLKLVIDGDGVTIMLPTES